MLGAIGMDLRYQRLLLSEANSGMKYYAVIDTNVLISAMLKWDSVPGNVLGLTFGGTFVPLS